ncbi:dihydrofolate reductase [Labedella gwakjiensis]|uniref:Dihydrofolate reductase n=1 Tax=Labedella gwakjiensis TaxID=390269 RepID=A0A2P8GUP7_9MICO|nr:dihydrofolate reductase family protein [Labedella gwakjiensis]PSL37692.1 dihydrofolate reductase [Labedella gwakjiensis]RUQ87714.1 dihydrofolate reductase [Labedella gwakjiensis]
MRELVYYVAVSLDGYIAGPDGQFDGFLGEGDHMRSLTERFGDAIPTDIATALDIPQPGTMFDTVLMGWNTYAVGLDAGVASPYRHLRQVVFSRTRTTADIPGDTDGITLTSENPVDVVRRLKSEPGSAIWLCGGGSLASALGEEIDRLALKRNPVLFGAGIPLFEPGAYAPRDLDEVGTTVFESGVVFSEYVHTERRS